MKDCIVSYHCLKEGERALFQAKQCLLLHFVAK